MTKEQEDALLDNPNPSKGYKPKPLTRAQQRPRATVTHAYGLSAILTQLHYCVPLTETQWDNLTRINARADERRDVIPRLEKSGAILIEYNGHFGRNMFFALEKESHLPRVLRKLEKITGESK